MQRQTHELSETYQAIGDTGIVYTIQVFTEVVHKTTSDGSPERVEGPKSHRTIDGHPILVHEDGLLEDTRDGITMRRITSP